MHQAHRTRDEILGVRRKACYVGANCIRFKGFRSSQQLQSIVTNTTAKRMKSWVRTNTGQVESGWNLSHPTLFAVAQVMHDFPSWARCALATTLVLLTFALRQLIV